MQILKTNVVFLIAALAVISSSFAVADTVPPAFSTEKYAALPFVAWRNNILFANAVLDRLEAADRCDKCKEKCDDICKDKKEDKCEKVCDKCFFSNPRTHLIALGEIGNGEVKFHGPKFDYNSWGISDAFDWKNTENLLVGAAFSGLMNNVSFHSHGGNVKLKHFQGALYFNYTDCDYFVSGMVTGGWNESRCHRGLFLFDADARARSHQTGSGYAFYLQEGLNINCYAWRLTPLFRVAFTSLHENHFHENCIGDFGLSVRPWTTSILRAYLEGRITRTFVLNEYCVTPKIYVAYAYDSVIAGKHVRATYDAFDGSYNSKVWSRNQGSLVTGGELDVIFGYGVTAFVRYDFQTNQRYISQAGQLGVTYNY